MSIIFDLARKYDLDAIRLIRVARTAGVRYKVYEIDKRGGGKRKIEHPSPTVKFLQRWVVNEVLNNLPVHDAATAYRKGLSIRENAKRHSENRFLLRVDLRDFFPSLTARDIKELIKNNNSTISIPLRSDDLEDVLSIVCRHGRLTIGAPSSPFLSNALMYSFDKHWWARCESRGIMYSRYADDIYYSTNRPNTLAETLADLRKYLNEDCNLNLRINEQKTIFTSKKRQRNITGLIITSEGKVSLGRARKRYIKSLIHSFICGNLEPAQLYRLKGLLSFSNSIEPQFLERLSQKYGSAQIHRLLGAPDFEQDSSNS